MTEIENPASPPMLRADRFSAAKVFFAGGGLLAALAVASCCALPIALSVLGISAASLVGIGYLAAQYQQELFYAAVICLGAAGTITWRQRRSRACAPGAVCARPAIDWTSRIAVLLGLALLGLTFWYEPPI